MAVILVASLTVLLEKTCINKKIWKQNKKLNKNANKNKKKTK